MRKIFMVGLMSFFIGEAFAQKNNSIEPSGNIVTKDVSVNTFDAIKADGIYELILSQSDKESVRIEADDNMQNLFSVKNDGSTLMISMPNLDDHKINISDDGKKDKPIRWKVYVSCKNLNRIDVGVIGNVRSATLLKSNAFEIKNKTVGNLELQLATAKLTVRNEGVGKMTLTGNATDAVIKNSGVGSLEGDDLLVQTMNIDNSGVGHASVNVQKDLTVQQSFLGKVSNKGNAKKHAMEGVEM